MTARYHARLMAHIAVRQESLSDLTKHDGCIVLIYFIILFHKNGNIDNTLAVDFPLPELIGWLLQ